MKQLQDSDKMPSLSRFKDSGAHQGKPMEKVPASYLHFLWTEFNKKDQVDTCPIADYINRNMMALQKEYSNGIW